MKVIGYLLIPVLPISNFWDFSQLLKALVPSNLVTGILLKSTIFDLLRICGLLKSSTKTLFSRGRL